MKYEEYLDNLSVNVSKYIKSIAMDIVVVIVAVAYVFYQMITLEPNEINPLVLIAQALMGIICGVVIKTALGENGFSRGYNSKTWIDQEEKYNKSCDKAIPYMDRVDNYYQVEEIEKKKKYRRQHLQEIRLKYEEWFDTNGDYIGNKENFKKLEKIQRRVLKKCIRVRIYPLNLFSQYTISTDNYTKKEMTDRKQRANSVAKNTISATLVAVIGVYFVPMFNNWSWASFISATMQVSLWVLFGILQLYTNFNYVVQDKVAILKTKTEDIFRFTSGCEKGLFVKSPYDNEPTQVNKQVSTQDIAKMLTPQSSNFLPVSVEKNNN